MRKRWVIGSLIFLVVAGLSSCWLLFGRGKEGERGYRRCVRLFQIGVKARSFADSLPAPLGGLVNKAVDHVWDDFHDLEDSLSRSGYLTNLQINLAEGSKWHSGDVSSLTVDHISSHAKEAVSDNSYLPLSLTYNEDRVWIEVQCRTQDVSRLRSAFETYWEDHAQPVDANERSALPVEALEIDRAGGEQRGLASSAHR